MAIYVVWPHHRAASSIRARHDSFVGNIDPFSVNAHAIVTVLGFPIRVINALRIGAIATWPFATMQALIPTVQLWVLIVVRVSMADCTDGQHRNENSRRCMPPAIDHLLARLQFDEAGARQASQSPMHSLS